MSASNLRVGMSFRCVLVAVAFVGSAFGIGWAIGTFRADRNELAPAVVKPATSDGRGELVFRVYCASCHGPEGLGDGPGAASLQPPPQDFAARPWRFAVTPESIRKVTQDGIPGTAMSSFHSALSSADLDAVAAHVYSLATANPVRAAGLIDLRGTDPPPLTLADAKDKCVKLSDLRGKLVLLHFWGTGCIHCVKEIPALSELEKSHAGQLVVLHVCTEDDPVAAQKLLDGIVPGTTSYSELTGLGLARFEPNPLPTVWLIDADGKAIGRASGVRDWRSEPMKKLIAHFLPK